MSRSLQIAFYAPFKPLDHPRPSGDLVIGRGIADWLQEQGHGIRVPSTFRMRWVYRRPWRLFRAAGEYLRVLSRVRRQPPDLWLTYHCYYKAPDLFGPGICRRLALPYVIIQGSFATKYRRRMATLAGYLLNRRALLAADLHITTRQRDSRNLRRLIPEERMVWVSPGLHTEQFPVDVQAGRAMRSLWQAGDRPVIISAAMLRQDVKSQGIEWLLASCHRLQRQGYGFLLVVVGDGPERQRLERLAGRLLRPGSVRFVGRVERREMHRMYAAGDLFVFPGIRESLGMVFLEAQCCGLPVVAFANGGIPEVVRHGRTGLLTPLFEEEPFDRAVATLLENGELRRAMGRRAAEHVRARHDLRRNYRRLEGALFDLVGRRQAS